MQEADTSLVHRAQDYDQDAMTTLYDANYPAVFRYIYYRLGDQACAEDLAAEVFVRMVERIRSYEPRGRPILAWLYTIAHNLIVDYFNQNAQDNALSLDEALIESKTLQPALAMEHSQERECLEKALAYLTEEQRNVILLKYIEDYEVTDVAAVMGRNERAIRSMQHRALAALNRAIEKEGCYGS